MKFSSQNIDTNANNNLALVENSEQRNSNKPERDNANKQNVIFELSQSEPDSENVETENKNQEDLLPENIDNNLSKENKNSPKLNAKPEKNIICNLLNSKKDSKINTETPISKTCENSNRLTDAVSGIDLNIPNADEVIVKLSVEEDNGSSEVESVLPTRIEKNLKDNNGNQNLDQYKNDKKKYNEQDTENGKTEPQNSKKKIRKHEVKKDTCEEPKINQFDLDKTGPEKLNTNLAREKQKDQLLSIKGPNMLNTAGTAKQEIQLSEQDTNIPNAHRKLSIKEQMTDELNTVETYPETSQITVESNTPDAKFSREHTEPLTAIPKVPLIEQVSKLAIADKNEAVLENEYKDNINDIWNDVDDDLPPPIRASKRSNNDDDNNYIWGVDEVHSKTMHNTLIHTHTYIFFFDLKFWKNNLI